MSSWRIDPLIIMKWPSLSLIILFLLSNLLCYECNRVNFFWLGLAWCLMSSFYFSLVCVFIFKVCKAYFILLYIYCPSQILHFLINGMFVATLHWGNLLALFFQQHLITLYLCITCWKFSQYQYFKLFHYYYICYGGLWSVIFDIGIAICVFNF